MDAAARFPVVESEKVEVDVRVAENKPAKKPTNSEKRFEAGNSAIRGLFSSAHQSAGGTEERKTAESSKTRKEIPVPPPDLAHGAASKSFVPASPPSASRPNSMRAGLGDSWSAPIPEPTAAIGQSGLRQVTVYYATDRMRLGEGLDWSDRASVFKVCLSVVTASLTVLFAGMTLVLHGKDRLLSFAFFAIAAAVAVPASQSVGQVRRTLTYGGSRGDLVFGSCVVSVPTDHRVGEVERPSITRIEFNEDPHRHFVVLDVREKDASACMCDIRECVGGSKTKEAFVFIHGYNTGFDEAAYRTAQIAHDLDFSGAPIFFSWPSQAGFLRYTVDENNVQWAVPHLVEFLRKLSRESGAKTIHLIAHSMGNRALTAALQQFAAEHAVGGDAPRFNEVVLAAPDIDADIFKRQIAPSIKAAAERVTLYASSNDRALQASRKVHGYPRAGDTGRDLVVVPGIDTVDVSAIDTGLLGHDYYGSNPLILKDLWEVIRDRKSAFERAHLRKEKLADAFYWVFDPQLAALPKSTKPAAR